MKRNIVLIALFLVVALALAQEPTVLAYKFNPGTTYSYALDAHTNMVQEMGGREMITDMNQIGKLTIAPQSVTEQGESVCWVSFSELSAKIKNAMMDTTLSMDDLIGKRTEITYAPDGKAVKIAVLDSIPKAGALMRMGLNPQLLLRRLLAKMPNTAITVGDTWTETEPDSIKQGGIDIVVTPTVQYSVLNAEEVLGHACLKIGFTGTNSLTGKGSQMGAEIFLEGEGKMEGSLCFAPEQGLLLSAESSSDQEQTIAISGAANMTIAQTVVNKSKLTFMP